MNKQITDLYGEMTEQLQQIAITAENPLRLAEQSYYVVEHTLKELKRIILSYTFKDKEEEIDFFKNIKPMFQKEMIYFWEVFQIEKFKSPGSRDDKIQHYMLGASRVDFYFKRHNELYTYYREGSTMQDARYFLREQPGVELVRALSKADIDNRFSTLQSFQFAKLQAYEKFNDYVHQQIYRLEHPGTEAEHNKMRIVWTDPKADLIELGYGIYARRSLNHGKADIKQIMTALEAAFNVNLGNFYRTYQNLRIRKKSRTPYLDAAKDDLIKTMDNADLNY